MLPRAYACLYVLLWTQISSLSGLPEEDIEVVNVTVDEENGVIIVDFIIMFLEFTEDILLMPDDLSDLINDPLKLIEALLTLPLFTGMTFVAEGVAEVVLIFPPPSPPAPPLAVSVFSGTPVRQWPRGHQCIRLSRVALSSIVTCAITPY